MYKSMYVVRFPPLCTHGVQWMASGAQWRGAANVRRPFLYEDPNETYFLDFVIKDKSKLSQQRLTSTDEGI